MFTMEKPFFEKLSISKHYTHNLAPVGQLGALKWLTWMWKTFTGLTKNTFCNSSAELYDFADLSAFIQLTNKQPCRCKDVSHDAWLCRNGLRVNCWGLVYCKLAVLWNLLCIFSLTFVQEFWRKYRDCFNNDCKIFVFFLHRADSWQSPWCL